MSRISVASIGIRREPANLIIPRQALQQDRRISVKLGHPFLRVRPEEAVQLVDEAFFSSFMLEIINGSDNFLAFRRIRPKTSLRGTITVVADALTGKASRLVKGTKSQSIIAESQQEIFNALFSLYHQKNRPDMLLFNAGNPLSNVHLFLREIYLKPHYHLFRTIPIVAVDYEEGFPLFPLPIRVLALNGSPRKKGNTYKIIGEEVERYFSGPYFAIKAANIPEIRECLACGGHQQNCKETCVVDDGFNELVPEVQKADVLLLGSPVYLDGPTARVRAFLSRLSGQAHHDRMSFIGKVGIPLSSGWCSGTKTTIVSMMDSLEMLGFSIPGRSTMENITLWADGKTRGGVPWDWFWPA